MGKTKISATLVKPFGPNSGGFAGWERRRIVTTGNFGNIARYAQAVKEKCSGHRTKGEAMLCLTQAVKGG